MSEAAAPLSTMTRLMLAVWAGAGAEAFVHRVATLFGADGPPAAVLGLVSIAAAQLWAWSVTKKLRWVASSPQPTSNP